MTTKLKNGGLAEVLCNTAKAQIVKQLMDEFADKANQHGVEFTSVLELECGHGVSMYVFGSSTSNVETKRMLTEALANVRPDGRVVIDQMGAIIDTQGETLRPDVFKDA